MKKLFALILAAGLLCGCTAEPPQPTTPDATEETTPATEEIVMDYESLELLEFDYENVYAAAPMGDDLLLFSGTAKTTLIRLNGRNHKELAVAATGEWIEPEDPAVRIGESGVCYPTETELVFLNRDLTETQRLSLPDAWRQPVVAADQQTVWYSTGSQLRVYDRRTGLDRLLRETAHSELWLLSLEMNDSVAVCWNMADDTTLFFSTATGEQLAVFDAQIPLASAGELWLTQITDGARSEFVFGTGDAAPRTLTISESPDAPIPVPGLNGFLIQLPAEGAAAFRFLDLAAETAADVILEGTPFVTNAWSEENILWFSLNDGRVCRWELEEGETEDAVSCIGPYYSRENPDTEGLAALEAAARELENTYSVRIHIAEDAVSELPADGTLISEYRVEALEDALAGLSAALSRFTPEFLSGVSKASADGKIHIALVRSVNCGGCFQFWDAGGNARMALAVGDALEQNFYHGLAHIIDARVMTKTTSFDGWEKLNPKGFDYDYDYAANANRDGSAYAGAFIDTFAMSFPTEDRARVFEYAMLPDSAASFESETMHKKLSTLCAGIRKAFKLTDADSLPWEQYLNP